MPSGSAPPKAAITPRGLLVDWATGLVGDRRDPSRRGGRPRAVQLRERYLLDVTGSGAVPMAVELARNAGKFGAAPRLHLLCMWLAGGQGHKDMPAFSTRRQLTDLALALGMTTQTPKQQRRLVRDALERLAGHDLIEHDVADDTALITLRDERGIDEPYTKPGTESGREHYYVTIRPELFTNGWFHALHHSTLFTYLAMIAMTERRDGGRRSYREAFANTTFRDERWGGWSNASYEHAIRLLDHVGLVTTDRRRLRDQRSRTMWTVVADGLDADAPARQLTHRATAAAVEHGDVWR